MREKERRTDRREECLHCKFLTILKSNKCTHKTRLKSQYDWREQDSNGSEIGSLTLIEENKTQTLSFTEGERESHVWVDMILSSLFHTLPELRSPVHVKALLVKGRLMPIATMSGVERHEYSLKYAIIIKSPPTSHGDEGPGYSPRNSSYSYNLSDLLHLP